MDQKDRYAQRGNGRAHLRMRQWHIWLVLLVTISTLYSLLLSSAGPGCLASWSVWTRRTVSRFPVVHTSTVCHDRCHGLRGAENCGISAVAVHAGRRHFLRCAEADFHGPCDHGDSPVTRGYGGRWPFFAVVQFTVVVQRPFPMVLPVRKTIETPRCSTFPDGRCPVVLRQALMAQTPQKSWRLCGSCEFPVLWLR